jgi:phosphatidylglycerophosphate synthase
MDAQQPTSSPDRDLRRSAHANGLAGLGLTLGLGLGLAGGLGLNLTYVPKALATYGLILLVLMGFLPLHGPRARLGPANQVTLLRGVLTALLVAMAGEEAGAGLAWTAFTLALIATTLDGVDGHLARRLGWASPLGARFDMEVDALLVAGLALLLWTLDRAGPWVLAAGAMRYVFLAAAFFWPWLRQPLPPSRRRQAVCVAQVLTLTLALAPILPAAWAGAVAALGLGLLGYSFAVDILWLARHHAPWAVTAPQVHAAPARGGGRDKGQDEGQGRTQGQSWAGWRPWLALAAALWLLNTALSFHGRWPTLWVEVRWELSPEIAFLVLALGLAAGVWGRPSRRMIAGLAGILTLLVMARYAAVMAPALYGRPVNLIADARYLPEVVPMLLQSAPWPLLLGLALALLLLLGLIFVGLRWALRRLADALGARASRRLVTLLGGATVVIYLAGVASPRLAWEQGFSRPVTLALAEQIALAPQALAAAEGELAEQGLASRPMPGSDLGRVRGAHVVILFAESYGAATFDQSRLAAALDPARTDLAAALAETGRGVVSALVRSPTFAGASWLAHASFLSGVEVTEYGDYAQLLTQGRETLVHRFADAGYRTLGVMPGLRYPWPEGAFYGYEAVLDAQVLDYRGPEMGWWRIPDQFALARLDAAELTGGDGRPRLAVLATISSHAPFRPTPPFQPEWGRILTADPFDPAQSNPVQIISATTEANILTDPGAAYADAVAYLFRVVAGWLRHRPDLDLVLLVLGDHQPLAAVSGEGASWEVPVHLITSRTEVRDAFLAEGFAPGLVPQRPALGGMADLTQAVLRALDSGRPSDIRAPGVNVTGPLGQPGESGQHIGGVQPAG